MGQLGAFWSAMTLKYLIFFLLAKVGVEGSNPFARSSYQWSSPETWVTVCS